MHIHYKGFGALMRQSGAKTPARWGSRSDLCKFAYVDYKLVRTVLTVTAPRMKQEYQRDHKQYFLAITVTKMLDHNNFFFRFLHRQEKTIERMLSLDENKHKDK